MKHPWFADLNLDDMMSKKLQPPYVPKVKSDEELLLDSEKTNLKDKKTKINKEGKARIKAHVDDFKGFTSNKE